MDEKRALQSVLRLLSSGGRRDPAAEMAREVLSRRMTLREAGNSLAYGEMFTQAVTDAAATMESTSPQQRAEAEAALAHAADVLDPPAAPPVLPPRRRTPAEDDDWDESVTSPWDHR
ncbi:hypothetical protein [Lentzea sp. NEAU-D7]|uniref:hypothetical protein n=1 Tax=Lentzea sp. NEAU-D7 TaxID=2994667 RepID=UPI00224AE9EE|nr:hypothetical protein [Lentzea sp. NEAU-D7]MCX2948949.1 hypothetical protein [Lentzea sp. NEAU-D7]